jgi:Collagen triple helix repeat (20 copies)
VLQFRSTIKKEENFMVKSLLIGLVAVLVLVTGATAATSKQSKNPLRPGNVNRLCVWVEQGGTPDTSWDLKAVKAYTATHKVCIVGKAGKNGKNGKAGAKGAQGNAGAQGSQGAAGAKGDLGAKGADGQNGVNGDKGEPGDKGNPGDPGKDGTSVTSAVEPEGSVDCPDGGTSITDADGTTYACNGADGADGVDGANGASVVTASEEFDGKKTFSIRCPVTPDPNDPADARMFAISGGFDIQGSSTASYRSNGLNPPAPNPHDPAGVNGWTITQTSGASDSGTIYVYCLA